MLPLSGGDADHALREPHRTAGNDVVAAVPWPAGSMRPSSAQAGSSGITGRRPWLPLPTRGMISGTSRGARAHAISDGDVAKRADHLERLLRRRHQLQRRRLRASASAGRNQSCSTISVPSNAAVCADRRRGDEEARVEALGPAERREPVAEVDERGRARGAARPRGTARRRRARRGAARRATAPSARRAASSAVRGRTCASSCRIGGEQQARFLEALAHRGDEVVEPAARAGRGVRSPSASSMPSHSRMRVTVAGIDDAARKHPRAAVVVAAVRRGATAAPRCLARRRARRRSSRQAAAAARWRAATAAMFLPFGACVPRSTQLSS